MAVNHPRRKEVQACLERYDIRKNSRLSALYPPGLYPHTRRCAILVPLFVSPRDGQLHVLLTQRASTLRSHASNVAFPGGAQDATDTDDTHTALREAHEEIGLDPDDVTIVAHLPPFFVRTCNSVYPIVGFIPSDFRPKPNPGEVALVFSVPFRRFVESDVSFGTYTMFGKTFRTSFLMHVVDDSPPLLIWGATCSVCVLAARAIWGPKKRVRLLLPNKAEEKSSAAVDAGINADRDDDDNVFGDIEETFHFLCKATLRFNKL